MHKIILTWDQWFHFFQHNSTATTPKEANEFHCWLYERYNAKAYFGDHGAVVYIEDSKLASEFILKYV